MRVANKHAGTDIRDSYLSPPPPLSYRRVRACTGAIYANLGDGEVYYGGTAGGAEHLFSGLCRAVVVARRRRRSRLKQTVSLDFFLRHSLPVAGVR